MRDNIFKKILGFALSLATICLLTSPVLGAPVSVTLIAEEVTATMPDATAIPMWGFRESTDTTNPGVWRIPTITALEGDDLTITLTNNLAGPGLLNAPGPDGARGIVGDISLVIPGQTASELSPARPWPKHFTDGQARSRVYSFTHTAPFAGGTDIYEWNGLRAGTYLIQSGTHPAVQMQMGLYAILKVDAAAGVAYPDDLATALVDESVPYDNEVTLLFSEIDPVLHEAVSLGVYGDSSAVVPSTGLPMTSTIDYKPTYFLINGQPLNTKSPLAAFAPGTTGQSVLLRFLNAGLQNHVPVTQGAYMTLVAEDGYRKAYDLEQYSVLLPPGKTIDAVIASVPAGPLPLYDRSLDLQNPDGLVGGMLAYLNAVPLAVIADVSLTSDPPGPRPVGTPQVVFTAEGSGGSAPYEYRFWLNTGGGFAVAQNYSTTNTWTYDTSALTAGTYSVIVHARNVGSTAWTEASDRIDYVLAPPATGATLTSNPVSPQQVGIPQAVFTAGGIGGSGIYEYRFWLNTGSGFAVAQNYSTTNTWTYDTSALTAGTYSVLVHVRNVGSTAWQEGSSRIHYVLTAPPPTGATLTSIPVSPQPVGVPQVEFTADGIPAGPDGTYEYRFWVNTGSGFTVVQNYSTTKTLTLNTSALTAGTYPVLVHVRSLGSTAWSEESARVNFVIQ